MIRNIFTFLVVFAGALGHAQSTTQNYTKEIIYKEGQSPSGNYTPGVNDFITTTYYDGFGRSIQQIQHKASPVDNKNIVTHIEYEKNLGQTRAYLPFTSDGGDNADFIAEGQQATLDYYNTAYYQSTANPYSENRMEAAPSARVLETGA